MAFDTTDTLFKSANDKITGWTKQRLPDLRNSITAAGIQHVSRSASPKAALDSLKASTRKSKGLISRIGFSIPRHMIYVEKGVGRGTTIGQVGNTNRKAKPWYNPVIDQNIEQLADIVAEELGSSIINNILIK